MLEYCQYYVMTAEYTALPQDRKDLISQHMDERLAMTGKQAAAAQGQPTEPPASGAAMLGAGAEPPAGPPPGNLMDLLTK
jgi:hypothetical protein